MFSLFFNCSFIIFKHLLSLLKNVQLCRIFAACFIVIKRIFKLIHGLFCLRLFLLYFIVHAL